MLTSFLSIKKKLNHLINEFDIEKIFIFSNLIDNDIDYSYMSESEILDEMLRIFYVTIANKKLSRFNDIMTDNIFEQIFGFSGKKLEQVSKYQNYVVKFEKKPLDYFKYETHPLLSA